jgi:hypothetical protein
MKVRKQRREQQMKEEEEESRKRAKQKGLGLDNLAGNIVADPQDGVGPATNAEDFFWEVAAVIGRRIHRNRVEYLIRWKGCSEKENTWEPATNLCDSASELDLVVKMGYPIIILHWSNNLFFHICFSPCDNSGGSDEILQG